MSSAKKYGRLLIKMARKKKYTSDRQECTFQIAFEQKSEQKGLQQNPLDLGRNVGSTQQMSRPTLQNRADTSTIRSSRSEPSLVHPFEAICFFTVSIPSILGLVKTQSDLNVRVKFTEDDNARQALKAISVPATINVARYPSSCVGEMPITENINEKRHFGESGKTMAKYNNGEIAMKDMHKLSTKLYCKTDQESSVEECVTVTKDKVDWENLGMSPTKNQDRERMCKSLKERTQGNVLGIRIVKSGSNIQFGDIDNNASQMDFQIHQPIGEPDQKHLKDSLNKTAGTTHNLVKQNDEINVNSVDVAEVAPGSADEAEELHIHREESNVWDALRWTFNFGFIGYTLNSSSLFGWWLRWLLRATWRFLTGKDLERTVIVLPARMVAGRRRLKASKLQLSPGNNTSVNYICKPKLSGIICSPA